MNSLDNKSSPMIAGIVSPKNQYYGSTIIAGIASSKNQDNGSTWTWYNSGCFFSGRVSFKIVDILDESLAWFQDWDKEGRWSSYSPHLIDQLDVG